jgi:hypothetical protein
MNKIAATIFALEISLALWFLCFKGSSPWILPLQECLLVGEQKFLRIFTTPTARYVPRATIMQPLSRNIDGLGPSGGTARRTSNLAITWNTLPMKKLPAFLSLLFCFM